MPTKKKTNRVSHRPDSAGDSEYSYGGLNIAVLIKHVPETENLKIDEKAGTVVRKGQDAIVNPLDLYAIEAALTVKDKTPKTAITVITMGPPDAERSLREALSMGCDNAVLISGREFAGSDTFATSLVLSRVIKSFKDYDLILCGERATDGDTGQVGPAVASFLDFPVITYVSGFRVESQAKDEIIAEVDRITEEGIEHYDVSLPAVLTISKAIGVPRLPTLSGKKRAKRAGIKRIGFNPDMFGESETGLEGSPTRVIKLYRPKVKRDAVIIKPKNEKEIEEAAEKLIDFLKNEAGVI